MQRVKIIVYRLINLVYQAEHRFSCDKLGLSVDKVSFSTFVVDNPSLSVDKPGLSHWILVFLITGQTACNRRYDRDADEFVFSNVFRDMDWFNKRAILTQLFGANFALSL